MQDIKSTIMSIPRFNLSFGNNVNCSPLSSCLQRDSLMNLIANLQFEEDGYSNSMECALSNNSYVLLCKSFYESFFGLESLPQSASLNGHDHADEEKGASILLILLLVSALIIIGLVLNNLVNIRKITKYQKRIRGMETDRYELDRMKSYELQQETVENSAEMGRINEIILN